MESPIGGFTLFGGGLPGGALEPRNFDHSGVSHWVKLLFHNADNSLYFGTHQPIDGDFVLHLGEAQFESSDASIYDKTRMAYVYLWTADTLSWSAGDTVSVSLYRMQPAVTDSTGPDAAQPNSPATGAPAVTGTARVGETLTASTTGIADADGTANAAFAYQWLADDAEITGATGSTYTLADADEGKAIKVRVTFTDDAGNDESLTSAATASVAAQPNSPATGAPAVTGTARVGETLTAATTDIADADGLTNARFTYQWLADDAEITGAAGSTYTLADADEGKAIKVRVTFTDDRGHRETLTSAATGAVAAAPSPLTASIHSQPASHDGSAAFTFELRLSETPADGFSYRTLRDHAFTVTGGEVTKARRLEPGKNIRWEITVQPSGNADVTVTLPATTDCDDDGAICAGDGRMLSERVEFTVAGPSG